MMARFRLIIGRERQSGGLKANDFRSICAAGGRSEADIEMPGNSTF